MHERHHAVSVEEGSATRPVNSDDSRAESDTASASGQEGREHPVRSAVRKGLWPTLWYGAKYVCLAIGSKCCRSPRMQKQFAQMNGEEEAGALVDSDLSGLVHYVSMENPVPLNFNQDLKDKLPGERQQQAERESRRNWRNSLTVVSGASILVPTYWTYSKQTAAALRHASRGWSMAYQINNAVTNIALNSREFGGFAMQLFGFIKACIRGEDYTGINPFTRGHVWIALAKLVAIWFTLNSSVTTAGVMYQGAECAGQQLDEPVSTGYNLWAAGVVAALYFPDILKSIFEQLDRSTFGDSERALRDQFAELNDAVQTVMRYGNAGDITAVSAKLPSANMASTDGDAGEPGYIGSLAKFNKNKLLQSLGKANKWLDRVQGWVFQPFSQLFAGVVVLAQTPLVRTTQLELPISGYGVLLLMAALPRIPCGGIGFSLLLNFALYFFDQRLIEDGLKDFFFKLVGLFRSDHFVIGAFTFLSLAAAAVSTIMSAVVMEHQTGCGLATAGGNHTDPGVKVYDDMLAWKPLKDLAEPASVSDAVAINFSGNAGLWGFMLVTIGANVCALLLKYCCCAPGASDAMGRRDDAVIELEEKMIRLEGAQKVALAMARQFDENKRISYSEFASEADAA